MNAAVFHQAVADGDATRVKFLINIGQQARVNQRNKQGYTSLQQSCKDGQYEVADVLLSHGANIATTDKKGRTALHLASAGGYLDIVKLLIASCADISVKDNEGKLAVDVAKSDEISTLLTKAAEEKEAKSPKSNKKGIAEDWSQNVTSLPAGSRNSLVSNSSSDSGVFTEENSSVRNGDYSKFTRANGYASFRGSTSDSRIMGVLNESDEHLLYENGRERSRTVHDIGKPASVENVYEQNRTRSNTFENHFSARTLHAQYELGSHLTDRRSSEESQYRVESLLNAGNSHDPAQHESHLTVQASMKMPHNTNPQPKLRRSMSERLPGRQRKRVNGLKDISEELSALNLSRTIAREPQNDYYYDVTSDRRDFRSNNLACIPEPQSPNEDLGYGGESSEISNDYDEFGRSSMRKFYSSNPSTLPRNRNKQVEFYPTRDQDWREEQEEEFVCGVPQFAQNTSNVCDSNGIDYYDNVDGIYRRKQPKNFRGVRRQTIEICPISSIEDRYLSTGDRMHGYSNNGSVQNFSQRDRPPSRGMVPENNRDISRNFDEVLVHNNVTLRRNNSTCSDTALGSYRRLMMQNDREYIDYNGNNDYYYEQDYTQDLPSYEETLKRLVGNDPRRSAPRQISHV